MQAICMSILMRVRLVFCGVAMKIPPAKIRHMKMPPQLHADVEHGPDWDHPPTPPRRCLRRKPAYLLRVS